MSSSSVPKGSTFQEDVTKPMIFVSAGTGFAPMRAFLWERLALRRDHVSLCGGGPVQRHSGARSRLHLPRRDRAVRHRRGARPRARRDFAERASRVRAGPAARARRARVAAARGRGYVYIVALSRCAPESATPLSISSATMRECRRTRRGVARGTRDHTEALPPRSLGLIEEIWICSHSS